MHAEFTYTGKVRGQGRPRFTRRGGCYEAKPDKAYKQAIAEAYREQCAGVSFGSSAVSVRIIARRPLPKGTRRATTSILDVVRPDVDNIAKAVMDALTGLAYNDDCQVVDLRVIKLPRRRDEVERLEISLDEIGDDNVWV